MPEKSSNEAPDLRPMPTNGHANEPIGEHAPTEEAVGALPGTALASPEAGSVPLKDEDGNEDEDNSEASAAPVPPVKPGAE